jgi:hypothetical protein
VLAKKDIRKSRKYTYLAGIPRLIYNNLQERTLATKILLHVSGFGLTLKKRWLLLIMKYTNAITIGFNQAFYYLIGP